MRQSKTKNPSKSGYVFNIINQRKKHEKETSGSEGETKKDKKESGEVIEARSRRKTLQSIADKKELQAINKEFDHFD